MIATEWLILLLSRVGAPDVWALLAYSLRLIPLADGETRASEISYRLELVSACVTATFDTEERYLCVKVAAHESCYSEDVGRCAVRGKAGDRTAWGIVPRSDADADRLCVTLAEDARVHVERVRESRNACRRLPREERMAVYARGRCGSEEGRRLSRELVPSDGEIHRLEKDRERARAARALNTPSGAASNPP